jgi:hypothetical protein
LKTVQYFFGIMLSLPPPFAIFICKHYFLLFQYEEQVNDNLDGPADDAKSIKSGGTFIVPKGRSTNGGAGVIDQLVSIRKFIF